MEMGVGRTGDGALGIVAMTAHAFKGSATLAGVIRASGVSTIALASLIALGSLSGCSSIGGFVGAAGGIAAGTVSSNPAVGVGVGIAVKAATDTAVASVMRDMQRSEQDRIANLAGAAPIGQRQPWSVHHWIPFNDEHGELEVVADLDNALAPCRTVMFSVIGGKKKAPTENWFATQTCQQPDGHWKWATAEPAVARWGNLQ